MRIEDQILISVDDHVVEPPSKSSFYRDHVPAAFKDRVPRMVRRPHRKREGCTVGAVRASALDIDTTSHQHGAQRATSKAVADGAGSFIESVTVATSAAM
jgi:hypothetical protein